MREVDKMPTKGQFAVMWTYDGEIWSNTMKYINGVLHHYQEEGNIWLHDTYDPFPDTLNPRFFVFEE